MSFFMGFLLITLASVSPQELNTIRVKAGENVPLQCHGPKDATITLLEWIRSDLLSEGYVFFYRDEHLYENYQHPSFVDRVELRNPGLKDGDVSVIVKNVTNSDTGRYLCYVSVSKSSRPKRASPDFSKTIELVVDDSGHTDGITGDGGDLHGHAAFSLFIGVIVAAFGIF
ncbi:hypothetical protein Q5P01_002960 [Channa striata]|uniref:Ig-like domain-containing protein n=1 Tax=Channa striata TaxID=64152 RepID=A0AA88NRE2_CHASR|nr:hypothetical protein Q5P01_002960 [Channa striata]